MNELTQNEANVPEPLQGKALAPLFLLGAVGLYVSSLHSYLLFHTLVELFCIFVLCSVSLLAWHSRRLLDNPCLLFLALSLSGAAALELVHTLAYQGLGIFPDQGANLPTQLWIAFRYLFSLSFLAAPLFARRRCAPLPVFAAVAAATCALFWAIFTGRFPDCFLPGSGLTPFKVYSEYAVIAILLGAMALFWARRSLFDATVLRTLLWSLAAATAAEASFTRYVSVYGFANLLGHLFLFLSAYLIYRAVVVTGLADPARILFRNLKLSEQKRRENEERYAAINERLSLALSSAQMGAWSLDLKTQLRQFDDQVCRCLGLDPARFAGTAEEFLAVVHPGDRPRLADALQRTIASGAPYEVEYRVCPPAGGTRHVAARGRLVRGPGGEALRVDGLVWDITARRQAEEALRQSEERVRRKLESVLSPEGDLGVLELADLVDAPALQQLMDEFYQVARFPVGILDVKGRVLVGAGWQEICTRFHRAHPESARLCVESDTELSCGVPEGEFRGYKCKNHLWDVATPIIVGGRHLGNIFLGQFFYEDEAVDRELFRAHALRHGFDVEAYLAALDRVPRLSRQTVEHGMKFLLQLASALSLLGYSNVKLARLLAERDRLTETLKRAHGELALQMEARNRELAEKEVLLKEIHHRVKNNLQVISSLVGLQSEESQDQSVREGLREVTYRVRSMALVHEKLYQSADLARVDFAEYAESLLRYLWQAHGAQAANVRLNLELASVPLPIDTAVPCGLILNELASNAFKHAFRGRTGGQVTVTLAGSADSGVRFSVGDDGVGMPPDLDWRRAGSLGLRLVQMLTGQLRGSAELERSGGTRFTITFDLPASA